MEWIVEGSVRAVERMEWIVVGSVRAAERMGMAGSTMAVRSGMAMRAAVG